MGEGRRERASSAAERNANPARDSRKPGATISSRGQTADGEISYKAMGTGRGEGGKRSGRRRSRRKRNYFGGGSSFRPRPAWASCLALNLPSLSARSATTPAITAASSMYPAMGMKSGMMSMGEMK